MRTKVFIVLAVVLAAIFAVAGLFPRRPRVGPWRLADGSELSLAGVTYGNNHAMRYGNRIVDYLYPVLTPTLRNKFGCKVATFSTAGSNAIIVWLWDKNAAWARTNRPASPPLYYLAAVDESGAETAMQFRPNISLLWEKTNVMRGMELTYFPRRSRQIGIRIYRVDEPAKTVAEFKILNRTSTNYPTWAVNPVPFTVTTNGLAITLASLATSKRNYLVASEGQGETTSYKSSAEFILHEDGKHVEENWRVGPVSAVSATGETRTSFPWIKGDDNDHEKYGALFSGSLWAEESAWKLTARVTRIANFPAKELWTVKGVVVPTSREREELNLKTNIYGSEIELISLVGNKPGFLLVRSPLPALDTELMLAGVKDDRGRKVRFQRLSQIESTGGRGATIRELDENFLLDIPEGALTLEITLAYTKSVSVEFMAKPTVVKEAGQK